MFSIMSIYNIKNTKKTSIGIISNRGLIISYDVKKVFKKIIKVISF